LTARGLAAVLAAGAAGAWVGTALLACEETTNTPAARARIRAARETGTVYTRVFDVAQRIPWPAEYGGRALANEFSGRWVGRENELAGDEDAQAELAAAREADDYDIAYQYAGQGVGLVTQERPAGEVIAELAAGAERLLRRWG
jgi:nitronate monooxygenase